MPTATRATKQVINNITNAKYYAGDTEKLLSDLIEKQNVIPDVVVVDPPRKGLDNFTIENIKRIKAEKVIYISCNPATLIRDLSKLEEQYEIMEKIYQYIKDHATKQSEALAWVEKQTHIRTNHARMLSGSAQGQIMRMLVQTSGASRILELGTFTGYSAICLASAMPEDGHLDTLEINDELEDLILEGFERAGLSETIHLHIGDCKETLRRFRDEGREYDLVYMDANKREYPEYYELIFDMVRPGGLILADNVLWDGKVCEDPMPQDKQTLGIARFNDMVTEDSRVESVILPLRDGLNLIRKKA